MTPGERRRVRELDRKLTAIDIPGTSRRERMLLEAIDSYLAREERAATPRRRAKLRREADAAIAAALASSIGASR